MFRELRVVDAKETIELDEIINIEEKIKGVEQKVKPKNHQCFAMDSHFIVPGTFEKDIIITIKTPNKPIDLGIDKFPEQYIEEMEKVQSKLNLNKGQIKKVRIQIKESEKQLKKLENDTFSQKKKIKELWNISNKVKDEAIKEKTIKDFKKSYSALNECLNSNMQYLGNKTKEEFRTNLDDLVLTIKDVKNEYLQNN